MENKLNKLKPKLETDNQDQNEILDTVNTSVVEEFDHIYSAYKTFESREIRERLQDKIMLNVVCEEISENLKNEILDNYDVSEESVDKIEEIIKSYPLHAREVILSYPYEVRLNMYEKWLHLVEEENGEEIFVKKLYDLALKKGFNMGFHLSNNEIKKEGKAWDVVGYELDDRDDMPMAYYSTDWMYRYRSKGLAYKYLYMIRSDQGEKNAHKRDLANNWSRANKLSIIDKIDLQLAEKKVEKIYEDYIQKKNKD